MGADLVQIYDIGTRFMIDSGWVVPMQQLIDEDKWDLSQVEPNIAAYYTVNGTLYSMPFNSSTPILYYNKDIFKKAGITEIPDSLPELNGWEMTCLRKGEPERFFLLEFMAGFLSSLLQAAGQLCRQWKWKRISSNCR